MIYVYAIKSKVADYIYVGMTNNLERRIREHNNGYSYATKPYAPFELIYSKPFQNRTKARVHEKFLKSSTGKRMLQSM